MKVLISDYFALFSHSQTNCHRCRHICKQHWTSVINKYGKSVHLLSILFMWNDKFIYDRHFEFEGCFTHELRMNNMHGAKVRVQEPSLLSEQHHSVNDQWLNQSKVHDGNIRVLHSEKACRNIWRHFQIKIWNTQTSVKHFRDLLADIQ